MKITLTCICANLEVFPSAAIDLVVSRAQCNKKYILLLSFVSRVGLFKFQSIDKTSISKMYNFTNHKISVHEIVMKIVLFKCD